MATIIPIVNAKAFGERRDRSVRRMAQFLNRAAAEYRRNPRIDQKTGVRLGYSIPVALGVPWKEPRGWSAPAAPRPEVGPCTDGWIVGAAFGDMPASALVQLVEGSRARSVTVTPWRRVILDGAAPGFDPQAACPDARDSTVGERRELAGTDRDVLTRARDPLLRVDACIGAPGCPSASVQTRPLARRLAQDLEKRLSRVSGENPERTSERDIGELEEIGDLGDPEHTHDGGFAGLTGWPDLHVSGCAKGCARSRPAAVTLVGRDGAFDIVLDGRAGDEPDIRGVSPSDMPDLPKILEARLGSREVAE